MALAFVGDESVVPEFKKTLIETKFDHPLNLAEREVILFTISGLGLLARQHDSAWEFVQQAIDPRYWKRTISWNMTTGNEQYGWLAGWAIAAVGSSGRAEAERIFERLKQEPYISDGKGGGWLLDGAIVDGAFARDLLERRGLDYFRQIYGSESFFDEYQKWKQTESGKKWVDWLRQWRKDHPKETSQ